MAEDSPSPDAVASEYVTANAHIKLGCEQFEAEVTVPRSAVAARAILPILQTFSGVVEAQARRKVEQDGKQISCRQGCGACCRQLVPITEIEARRLAPVVDGLPEPRRSVVRGRFAAAIERLREADFLETMRNMERVPNDDRTSVAMAYFRLGIPCPFLELESCSIHADRPLVCREYLVISPAANCAQPTEDNIKRVALPVRLSPILRTLENPTGPEKAPWVALVMALELAETQPDLSGRRPGPEWVTLLLDQLDGRPVPSPTGQDTLSGAGRPGEPGEAEPVPK